jgi:hypothetical protein
MKKSLIIILPLIVVIIGTLTLLLTAHLGLPAKLASESAAAKKTEYGNANNESEEQLATSSVETTISSTTSSDTVEAITPAPPTFRVMLRAPATKGSSFERTADLFVSNGGMTAGEDSRASEVLDDYGQADVVVSSGTVEIELKSFDRYSSKIEVAVLGLLPGNYEILVSMTDKAGLTREYTYASSTAEGVLGTYTFALDTVTDVRIDRRDYGQIENGWPQLEEDGGVCDTESLTQQLTDLLRDNGWDMNDVPLVIKKVGFIYSQKFYLLPFKTKKVCAANMIFINEYENKEQGTERKNFSGLLGYSSEAVIVEGEKFYQSPADGPLGSSNEIPFSVDGKGIQSLYLSEGVSLIPVNFPAFSTCPCANRYEALLTAPMYPPKR